MLQALRVLRIAQQHARSFQSLDMPPATFSIYRNLASSDSSNTPSWGSWLKDKIPSAISKGLGGGDGTEELTLDTFATSLKQARRMGSLTGFVHGSSNGSDPSAVGTMRLFENIVNSMTTQEKTDLSTFNSAARGRVASEVGCTTSQVDDCIARYLWMKQMTNKVQELKRQGREMPKSIGEMESMLGNWRSYKSETQQQQQYQSEDGSGSDQSNMVPLNQIGPKGAECPLAGMPAGKNTKCPLTRKAYKACCGKKIVPR